MKTTLFDRTSGWYTNALGLWFDAKNMQNGKITMVAFIQLEHGNYHALIHWMIS